MENKARIQKVLSDQGILSRRRTEELIKEGRITVNGRPAQPGHRIDIRRDIVAIDGERIWFQKKKKNYLLLLVEALLSKTKKIGRASWRERV